MNHCDCDDHLKAETLKRRGATAQYVPSIIHECCASDGLVCEQTAALTSASAIFQLCAPKSCHTATMPTQRCWLVRVNARAQSALAGQASIANIYQGQKNALFGPAL
eukprot:6206808-Pleurochrysis_carterae.AAC.4